MIHFQRQQNLSQAYAAVIAQAPLNEASAGTNRVGTPGRGNPLPLLGTRTASDAAFSQAWCRESKSEGKNQVVHTHKYLVPQKCPEKQINMQPQRDAEPKQSDGPETAGSGRSTLQRHSREN
ncbi:hypothetical protein AMECASPLE_021525 [Ameca splendens]|uniref:Uncharacterized protein n=1 Tax=Ameca splendens TaxID=208324 RepID=A0ABV0XSH2_9TELE